MPSPTASSNHPPISATPPPRSATKDRASSPITEGPGSRIGPYKLLQQIGEGGMGVVYMAEQETPVRRKVALKIIKPGMDTRPGRRPLRGRTPGPGPDGPSQHRPASSTPAPPTPAGPTSSWSWSTAIPITQYCDAGQAQPPRAARAVHPRLPGHPACPPEGDHPPRHQAVERPGHAPRRQAGAQDHRLRRGQGDRSAAD